MKIKQLKGILDRVGSWPKDAQEELIRSVTEIESRYTKVYHLDDDERAALKRSEDDVRHGRFPTSDGVEFVFDKFHRT
jgi:hypothetical protein